MDAYRVLLVGAGQMGRGWARNLLDFPETDLVAWVDIRQDVAAQAAAEQGLGGVFTGTAIEDAIALTKPDFVVDVSSPEAHHDVTVLALSKGLPVLGEKPMATSMDQARDMIGAAERAGKLYMVSQNRRFDPNLHALRRLITAHTGPVGILNADFYMGEHYSGFRIEMGSPLLVDMAIHTFDAARFLTGADPVSAYCVEFNPPWSWYRTGACATVIFEMTSGALFTYRGSRCSDGWHTSWDANWRVVGPRGTAIWDGRGSPEAEIVAEPTTPFASFQRVVGTPDATQVGGIAGTLRAFVQALRTGITPPCECHDNIKSLAMVHAAIESAAAGQRVSITI